MVVHPAGNRYSITWGRRNCRLFRLEVKLSQSSILIDQALTLVYSNRSSSPHSFTRIEESTAHQPLMQAPSIGIFRLRGRFPPAFGTQERYLALNHAVKLSQADGLDQLPLFSVHLIPQRARSLTSRMSIEWRSRRLLSLPASPPIRKNSRVVHVSFLWLCMI